MTFPELLRHLRLESGMTLVQVAQHIRYDRTAVHHFERGRRPVPYDVAEKLDEALKAGGRLVDAWRLEDAQRREAAAAHRTKAAALAMSNDLSALADLDIAMLQEGIEATAVDYLSSPPAPMMDRAHVLRAEAFERIRSGHHRSADRSDLYVAAGRLSGVLAYALLDMGDADEATAHADAAGRCAEYAGDAELAAWVAGTKSLIARFQGDYGQALEFVRDGYQWVGAGHGTGEARLKCGEAQCLATLGDSRAANAALDDADLARERMRRPDSLGGLFGFSQAKQSYYAGSSLIWLQGGHDAERAAREAEAAIELWQAGPEPCRAASCTKHAKPSTRRVANSTTRTSVSTRNRRTRPRTTRTPRTGPTDPDPGNTPRAPDLRSGPGRARLGRSGRRRAARHVQRLGDAFAFILRERSGRVPLVAGIPTEQDHRTARLRCDLDWEPRDTGERCRRVRVGGVHVRQDQCAVRHCDTQARVIGPQERTPDAVWPELFLTEANSVAPLGTAVGMDQNVDRRWRCHGGFLPRVAVQTVQRWQGAKGGGHELDDHRID